MSNKLLSMSKIKQILRCYAQGKGTKSISRMLVLSRNTVKKYLQEFQQFDISYEQVLPVMSSITLWSNRFILVNAFCMRWTKRLRSRIKFSLSRI